MIAIPQTTEERFLDEMIGAIVKSYLSITQATIISVLQSFPGELTEYQIMQKLQRNFSNIPEKQVRHELFTLYQRKIVSLTIDQAYKFDQNAFRAIMDKVILEIKKIKTKYSGDPPNLALYEKIATNVIQLIESTPINLKDLYNKRFYEANRINNDLVKTLGLFPLYLAINARLLNHNINWLNLVQELKHTLLGEPLPEKPKPPVEMQKSPEISIESPNRKFKQNPKSDFRKKFSKPHYNDSLPSRGTMAQKNFPPQTRSYEYNRSSNFGINYPGPQHDLSTIPPSASQSQEYNPTSKIPKKRGRPPKISNPNAEPTGNKSEPRKRGRPPKSEHPENAPSSPSAPVMKYTVIDDTPRKRGRPPKDH